MEYLRHTHMIVVLLISVVAVMSFMAAHDSCHMGQLSVCFLTMCALVLTAGSIGFLLLSNPLLATVPANSGVSIKFRLDRPPRS